MKWNVWTGARTLCLSASVILLLSGCNHTDPKSSAVACQTRPDDDRIEAALVQAIDARSITKLMGVSVSCNSATVVYQYGSDTNLKTVQLVGADNGKWFIVSGNGFSGIRIADVQ